LNRRWNGVRFFMLKWAIACLIAAIISGMLGYTEIAGAAAPVAKVLFYLLIAVFILLLIAKMFLESRSSE